MTHYHSSLYNWFSTTGTVHKESNGVYISSDSEEALALAPTEAASTPPPPAIESSAHARGESGPGPSNDSPTAVVLSGVGEQLRRALLLGNGPALLAAYEAAQAEIKAGQSLGMRGVALVSRARQALRSLDKAGAASTELSATQVGPTPHVSAAPCLPRPKNPF